MNNFEKKPNKRVSSLNDDAALPRVGATTPEYIKGSLSERKDISEGSVLERAKQLGITTPSFEIITEQYPHVDWNIYNQHLAEAISKNYQLIVSTVFEKSLFAPEFKLGNGVSRWEALLDTAREIKEVVNISPDKIELISRGDSIDESRTQLVLGLEGGAHLIDSTEKVDQLIEMGVTFYGIQYNADNKLASKEKGLSKFGKEIVLHIIKKGQIIDLAHATKKTRKDILDLAQKENALNQISYTHGSTPESVMDSWSERLGDDGAQRLISHEELLQIAQGGGLIGICVTHPFVNGSEGFAQLVDKIAQTTGDISNIAVGGDFGGLPPYFLESSDIKSVADVYERLGAAMSEKFNFSDSDIDKVVRTNPLDWISKQ